jgi:hypothetical protein
MAFEKLRTIVITIATERPVGSGQAGLVDENHTRVLIFGSGLPASSKISPPEAVVTKGVLQDSQPTQKAKSSTVIEHVLSSLKDLGISKVFGVAGDFAFASDACEVSGNRLGWML